MITIGERLKKLRLNFGMTQGEVARAAGISQQSYSYYENDMRNMDSKTLIKISQLYGVASDYILGIEGQKIEEQLATKTVSYTPDEASMDKLVENVIRRMYEKISEDGDK